MVDVTDTSRNRHSGRQPVTSAAATHARPDHRKGDEVEHRRGDADAEQHPGGAEATEGTKMTTKTTRLRAIPMLSALHGTQRCSPWSEASIGDVANMNGTPTAPTMTYDGGDRPGSREQCQRR